MKSCLHILIAASLCIVGFPHLLCNCCQGERGEVKQASVAVCPHCHQEPSEQDEQQQQEPCRCRCCEVAKAVIPNPAVAAAPDRNWSVHLVSAEAISWSSSACAPEDVKNTGPPGFLRGSPPDLPILLGHLLF